MRYNRAVDCFESAIQWSQFKQISREVSRFLVGPRELTRSRGKQHGRLRLVSQTFAWFVLPRMSYPTRLFPWHQILVIILNFE